MTSFPRRDPRTDNLLTPENAALLVIDYQPTQINSIQSIPHPTLIKNVAMTIQLHKVFKSQLCYPQSTSRLVATLTPFPR